MPASKPLSAEALDIPSLLVDCKKLDNPWIHAEPKELAIIRVAKALPQALARIEELEGQLGAIREIIIPSSPEADLVENVRTMSQAFMEYVNESAALQREVAGLRALLERARDRMYVHQGATTRALVAEIEQALAARRDPQTTAKPEVEGAR